MSGAGPVDGATPTWRVTGWRRWLYVVLLVHFLVQAAFRLVELVTEPPLRYGDGFLLVIWLVGAVGYGVIVLQHWRTRVTLLAHGIEIRSFRTRVVSYSDVVRAHRSRWSRGAVTLDLVDAGTLVLPAPVAAPKDPGPALDEAVDLVNARATGVSSGLFDEPPG